MHLAVKTYAVPASIGLLTGLVFAIAKTYLPNDMVNGCLKVSSWEYLNHSLLSFRMRELALQAFSLRFCDTLLTYGMGLLLWPPAMLCGLKALRTKPNQSEFLTRFTLTMELTIYVSMVLSLLVTLLVAAGSHNSVLSIKFALDFVSMLGLAFLELWMSFYPIAVGGLIYIFASPTIRSRFTLNGGRKAA